MMPADDQWVDHALRDLTRWGVLFLHLGAAYPDTRATLVPKLGSVVGLDDYLVSGRDREQVVAVTEVESLCSAGAPSVGRLRERVFEDRERGIRVILVSRLPRIAFPVPQGSSILYEANLLTPPTCVQEEPNIDDTHDFGREVRRDGIPFDVVVANALREFGPVGCAELDAALFEDQELDDLPSLSYGLRDALVSSGLVVRNDDKWFWTISEQNHQIILKDALSDVIAEIDIPATQFAQVSASCWAIDRSIKNAIRARSRALWRANWKAELLTEELRHAVVSRATDGDYRVADNVTDVRDPLEWLSLAETLDLRLNANSLGSLGVSEAMWSKLRTEVLPVKARIDQSRLLRKHDLDIARRWIELLNQRLSRTGSRDPSDAASLATKTQREVFEELWQDLRQNGNCRGDIERDFLAIVLASIRFISHVTETRPPYTATFSAATDAPLEKDLQNSYKAFLDSSDIAGRVAAEVSSIAGGRADVVVYFDNGTRYVTEIKREFAALDKSELEKSYLPQASVYQSANVPFGQLLILDLSKDRTVVRERVDQCMWIAHQRDDDGVVLSSTLVSVIRGNRPVPSRRR